MFGEATEEQWEKMKKFIKSDKYKKEDFFVFETLATGDREIPNRYTRIDKSALEVMEEDAKRGVSLMLNHNEGQLGVQSIPIGKVFDARMGLGTQAGEENALYMTQYILKDESKVDGYSKNDIIKLVESGILEDTSVCFSIPRETCKCSICKNPYYSSKCSHWQGAKYIVDEETNEVDTCIVEVNAPTYSSMQHNGNVMLIENSIVFDGAYANAKIQNSVNSTNLEQYSMLKAGSEKEEKTVLNEGDTILCYATGTDMKLMYKDNAKGGSLMEDNKELATEVAEVETKEELATEVTEQVTEQVSEQVEETVENAVDVKVEVEEKVEQMSIGKNEILEAFGKEDITKEMILQYAKEGMEHRNNVIEEALKSGIKSMGNDFNTEAFRKSFEGMSTADILQNKEVFDKQVLEKFGNARVSRDNVQNEEREIIPDIDLSQMTTMNY